MFNPEKMLGGLLRGGLRRGGGGLGSLVSGGAALGLLGVAMEAVEHYMNRPTGAPAPGMPPPLGPAAGGRVAGTAPLPLPGRPTVPPPLPSGGRVAPAAPATAGAADNAVLLIRAMIAAANADGVIDAQERTAILDKLKSVQLSPEEQQFIVHELLEPKPLQTIVAAVASPELARQVYLASLLAISVDSDEEIDYLQRLAQNLKLDPDTIGEIHQQAGVEVIF
jgi:uncharacterized membrane protein YebE (DUF533 family)